MASSMTPISIGAPQPWPSSSSSSSSSSLSSPPSSSKAYNYNYDCSLSLCSVNCPQFCGVVIPPPPPLFLNPNDGSNDDSSSSSHISPLMAALIAVLAAAFLLLFYFTVISKLCRRRRNQTPFLDPDNADRIDSLIYDSTRPTTNNESGLDDNFIRQITVFKFRREDKLIDGTECAVCLTEFNENESLRLMPNCEHAFHLPCIDTWLKTHSNCPLCRSTMNPVIPVPNPNPNPTARSSVGSMGSVSNNAATASVAALRVQRSNDAVLVIRELESRVQVVETTADDEVGSRGGGGGECRNYIIEDNNNYYYYNRDTKLEINNNNSNNNHRNSR